MKDFRGCLFSSNPHDNFRNSLNTMGIAGAFTGCERSLAIKHVKIRNFCHTLDLGGKPLLFESPWLQSLVFITWEYERSIERETNK